MTEAVVYQVASIENCMSLLELLKNIWPEQQAPDQELVQKQIARILNKKITERYTLLAQNRDEVCGFVDSFLTVSKEQIRRWELDLLGVVPKYARKGIGSTLVKKSEAIGKLLNCHICRALVRSDNFAMMATMTKNQYRKGTQANLLLMCYPSSSKNGMQAQKCVRTLNELAEDEKKGIVEVQTLQYAGVWIETEVTMNVLRYVETLQCKGENLISGIVIEKTCKAEIQLLLRNGYENCGEYFWWQKLLNKQKLK